MMRAENFIILRRKPIEVRVVVVILLLLLLISKKGEFRKWNYKSFNSDFHWKIINANIKLSCSKFFEKRSIDS